MRKMRLISKFKMMSSNGKQVTAKQISPNISRSECNQIIKFGPLIENNITYYKKNNQLLVRIIALLVILFIIKLYARNNTFKHGKYFSYKIMHKISPRHFLKNQTEAYLWIKSLIFLLQFVLNVCASEGLPKYILNKVLNNCLYLRVF